MAVHIPEVKSSSNMDNGQQPNGTYALYAVCIGAALIIHPYRFISMGGGEGGVRR